MVPTTRYGWLIDSGDSLFTLVMSAGTRVAILNGLRLRSEAVEVSALCSVVRLLEEISI